MYVKERGVPVKAVSFSIAGISFCYCYHMDFYIEQQGIMKEFYIEQKERYDVLNDIFPLSEIEIPLRKDRPTAVTPAWTSYGEEDNVIIFHPDGHYIGYICMDDNGIRTYVTNEDFSPHLLPLSMTGYLLQVELNRKKEGFIMHGATLTLGKEGMVLSGNSGVGKSTLSKLFREYAGVRILTDDRIIVSEDEDSFIAYGNPLDRKNEECHNDWCRIKMILMLSHGEKNELLRLNRNEAIKALLTICLLPYGHEENLQKSVSTMLSLASKIPVYSFSFVPNEGAVQYFRETMGLIC